MKDPLVSIITPCFNGEKFISRFLDSVLDQTYNNIEMILVNDGSTDQTESIVLGYKKLFERENINLIYIYQKNAGQASALNQGLKIFKGKYLTWPDSDDILDKNNIKYKVEYMEEHNNCGLVLCKSYIVYENNINEIVKIYERKKDQSINCLFIDLIIENNVCFCPGGYMIRSDDFIKINPKKHIYECSAGQNWQMLLPMSYHYKCGYLDDILYWYVIRENSHSRKERGKDELIQKTFNHEETLNMVIKGMYIEEEKHYLEIIRKKYIYIRFGIACSFQDKKLLEEQYELLKQNKIVSLKDKTVYWLSKFHVYNTARYLKRLLKGLWK